MRRAITVIAIVLATAGVVAGCSDKDDPIVSPSTTPTTTATTQSPEQQAEAAAWDAYLEYLKVDAQLSRKPVIDDAIRLVPTVATAPLDGYMVAGVQQYYIDKGRRMVGGDAIPTKTASNVRSASEVVLDVCLDNSAVDVVDKDGNSVIKDGHPKKVKITMTVKKVDGKWLVSNQDGGTEPC